jgi:hypothetical protein
VVRERRREGESQWRRRYIVAGERQWQGRDVGNKRVIVAGERLSEEERYSGKGET